MVASFAALFVMAAALAVLVTPAVRAAALRLDIVDLAGGRHIHRGRIPRLGGVAILLAGAGALAVAQGLGIRVLDLLHSAGWNLGWLLAGAALILAVGVADDVLGVGPFAKLGLETVAALIALAGGYGFAAVTNPLSGGVLGLAPFGGLVTVLWIVAITNAFNLIDGLDGLAAGTGLIASVTLFLIALLEQRPDAAVMAVTLAGVLAGFLRFNFNPATIFLGDAGSLLVGYLLAVLSIQSLQKGPTAVVTVVPVLALGLPILEALVTVARRVFVAGMASVFQADQAHIHHRLLALGMTHRRAVLVLYAVCAAFGAVALLAVGVNGSIKAVIVGAVAIATFFGIRTLGYRVR